MIEYRDIYKAFDMPVLAGVSLKVETGSVCRSWDRRGRAKERPPQDH